MNESLERSETKLMFAYSARVLDERERRIVLRFHADMTERDIAREMRLSQAHVSRLLDGALAKLRHALGGLEAPAVSSDTAPGPLVSPAVAVDLGRDPAESRPVADDADAARIRISDVGESEQSETAQSDGRDAAGSDAPMAPASPRHSGRFLVRMPGELHTRLSQAAEREAVSLNRYVTDVLAASVASADVLAGSVASPDTPDSPEPRHVTAEATTEATTAGPAGARPPRALRIALATNLVIVVLAGVMAVALLVVALHRGV